MSKLKVINFPGPTTLPIKVEDMLDECKKLLFDDVLIIGIRNAPEVEPLCVCLSQSGRISDALLFVRLAERRLVDMAEDELYGEEEE